MKGSIYKAVCRTTGRAYIGQSRDSNGFEARRRYHIRISKKAEHPDKTIFHRALNKYGPADFDWEVLLRCDADQLDDAEAAAIAEHGTLRPGGLNIRNGASGRRGVRGAAYKRKHAEEGLPANVTQYHSKGIHIGYTARFDNKTRNVVSRHLTMDRKREIATQWLQDRQSGVPESVIPKTRQPGNEDLPSGIYRAKAGRKTFEVNMRGHKRSSFATLAEALQMRKEYIMIDCIATLKRAIADGKPACGSRDTQDSGEDLRP